MGDTAASTDPRRWAAPKPSGVRRFLPILVWLPNYDRHFLRFDLIAAATVWGLLVPESIAYSGLAGLPPQAGLYTLLVTLAAYAVFGTSRHLIAAATSAAAVLLASSISGLSPPDASHYASDAAALVLFCGGLFVVAGLLRLGFVAQFLSRPVMEGFVFGLAIFVTVSQLPKLFGIKKGTGDTIAQFLHPLGHLGDTNGATFAIGASTLALLFASIAWRRGSRAGCWPWSSGSSSAQSSTCLSTESKSSGTCPAGCQPPPSPSSRAATSRHCWLPPAGCCS